MTTEPRVHSRRYEEKITSTHVIQCTACWHSCRLSTEQLRQLAKQCSSERNEECLYVSDVKRFRCSLCGAKAAELVPLVPKHYLTATRGGSEYVSEAGGHDGWTAGYDY